MNLKRLKEKRESLLDELTSMVDSLEGTGEEVRTLTSEEVTSFETKKAEIENINKTITVIEERRAMEIGEDAVKELKETRSKEEVEKRALENFFRGNTLESEERMMLASNSANSVLMPVEVVKTIMQKLEERCPILDHARRFNSKGTLKLLREDSYGAAAITPENTDFQDADVSIKTVEIRSYKVSAKVQATFEMLQNSDVDLTNYLLDVIVRRLSAEMNRLFLIGKGTNEPEGILTKGMKVSVAADMQIGDYIKMQTSMHPDYLNGAMWIANRDAFTKMATLLDNNGRPYLINNYDAVNNKISYTFLGLPVVVDYNADKVGLVNIGESYAINVLTDITVRHLTEKGFDQGYEEFAGYTLCDGRVVNKDAIVLAEPTVASEKKVK